MNWLHFTKKVPLGNVSKCTATMSNAIFYRINLISLVLVKTAVHCKFMLIQVR